MIVIERTRFRIKPWWYVGSSVYPEIEWWFWFWLWWKFSYCNTTMAERDQIILRRHRREYESLLVDKCVPQTNSIMNAEENDEKAPTQRQEETDAD